MSLDLRDGISHAYGSFISDMLAEIDYTMFCWVKRDPTLYTGASGHILTLFDDNEVTSSTAERTGIYVSGATEIASYAEDGGWNNVVASPLLSGDIDNVWVPVMVSHDRISVGNYLTGIFATVSEDTNSTTINRWAKTLKNGLLLGSSTVDGAGYFDGLISHVCIWEGIALTAANFTTLASGVDPTTVENGFIHSYYPLNSTDGLTDQSGNGETTLTHSGTPLYSIDEPFGGATLTTQTGAIDVIITINGTQGQPTTQHIFQNSTDTNLFDGTDNISESGLHWALFDLNINDISNLTQIAAQGTALNIITGIGTLSTPLDAGEYVLIIQSPTTNQIGTYIVTLA